MHKMRIEHSIVLESKEVPTEGKWKITGEEGKWKITGEEKKRKKKNTKMGLYQRSTGVNWKKCQ